MATITETGHAKNAANFDVLITCALGYGAGYKPSKASLAIPALQIQSASVHAALRAVNASLPAYNNAVAIRSEAFAPLNPLLTRVFNALKATDASEQIIDTARALVRKLQGVRATPRMTDEEKAALPEGEKAPKEISSSQLSFDNRLDNFDKLIQLLGSIPFYAPNERELQLPALTSMYDEMVAKNTDVVAATVPLYNARITRNQVLYAPGTGLVDTAADVKSYVKSVFGAGSSQFKQVSILKFKSEPS